jgi:predicted lysophospholipase L1 biosynthesis ABC-type transport system permease subunit
MAGDPAVGSALRALWSRAVPINGVATPTFGIATVRGRLPLVVLSGHAPRNASELALAPSTQRSLQLHVGDTVRVGKAPGRTVHVVGTAFLPSSSHTGYDESGWMTLAGLRAAVGPDAFAKRPDDFEDYLLLRWRPGANVAAAERRISKVAAAHGYFSQRATLPTSVVDLGHLGSVPLVLAVFFALLAAATVAHALVTTVRRRRFDLAVLRSMGFTRRQSRFAIAWQAMLLAAIGLLVGVPLGLVMGRVVWRWVADEYPVAYVPPIAALAVLVIVPVALIVAQALAAGPAHAAARIRPAQTLRAE